LIFLADKVVAVSKGDPLCWLVIVVSSHTFSAYFTICFVICLLPHSFHFFQYETIEKIHHKLSENSTSCSMSFPREMEEEASSSYYILSCAYCVGFLWTFSAAFPPNVTTGYFCVCRFYTRSVRHSSRSATSPPYKQSSTLRR
jgi:hypothetical protein